MPRILTVCACAMVATLLLCSDASACHWRRACCAPAYDSCGASYGGYGAAYGGYGYGSYSGYGFGGVDYGYGAGYDIGRPGYNPGGLGGPASGLGVRPGAGVGGFGPRR